MGKIYLRKENRYIDDSQYGGGALKFLYDTPVGRVLLKLAVSRFPSVLYGWYNKLPVSARNIQGFVKKNNICMDEYEGMCFTSFTDFFTRKRQDPDVNMDEKTLISPADSKILVYDIDENLTINVKHSSYYLNEILGIPDNRLKALCQEFKGGHAIVFRLAVDDYHRYCFMDSGKILKRQTVKGLLHTVSSASEKHKVYARNTRVCNYLETENLGHIIVVEVGAMMIGRIINHPVKVFKKGEEKGYFEPGGSTIVAFVRDNVSIDEDILKCSSEGIETKVRYGERIGQINA